MLMWPARLVPLGATVILFVVNFRVVTSNFTRWLSVFDFDFVPPKFPANC